LIRAALFAAALTLLPRPGEAAAPAAEAPTGGWIEAPASLLLYSGEELIHEIGLGEWREDAPGGIVVEREMRGGVYGKGRFAWHWHRARTIRRGRDDEVISSTRTFVYLGTRGQTLWRADAVDAPPGLEPAVASANGETVLVIERGFDGWSAAAYTFTGNRITATPGADRIERFALTRNGRFATVLASATDKPLVYLFIDLETDARKDIPAADAPLGEATIDETGRVLFGKKTVFRFQ
jgi:hypothetical protein